MMRSGFIIILSLFIISSCSSPEKRTTLRDVDIVSKRQSRQTVFIKPKSDDQIRKAYAEYLQFAAKDDTSRLAAITRLAELEFELGNRLIKENENLKKENSEDLDEQLYNSRLDKTIELLATSLREYPDAKGNDKILYNIANAYDQKGKHKESRAALDKLVLKYPKSSYYIESQFRVAEHAFSAQDYIKAEDAYTDVLGSRKNDRFIEKARFKRGWSRFKLEYYLEAVEDFLETVTYHDFADYNELDKSEIDLFKEYFRAIGLSFSYLGGVETLNRYFKDKPDFKYLYYTYSHIGDIYKKQHRYSDAADTIHYFIKQHPDTINIPESRVKIVEIWKEAGFTKRAYDAIEYLYVHYNPKNKYWLKNNNSAIFKLTTSALKQNITHIAANYHNQYQKRHKKIDFNNARKWYDRYLEHYSSSARKDNIHFLYAELLSEGKHNKGALTQYELAAYDTDIILNKQAAYSTILLTSKLYKNSGQSSKKTLLDKHIKYSTLFSQLYQNDKRTIKIIAHATEIAYKAAQYEQAIELAELIPGDNISLSSINTSTIKAHSYFRLNQYKNSEAAYQSILYTGKLSKKRIKTIQDKLALSIYKQAEAESKTNIDLAIYHYLRVAETVPESNIAPTGIYDAIALSMNKKLWNQAIEHINKFKQFYPKHKLNRELTKSLSVAYLNSGQDIKAAREYERISATDDNKEFKIAALWKAAELYESKNDIKSALRSYKELANKYQKPYPQHIEAMNKIVNIYSSQNNRKYENIWQNKILKSDRRTSKKQKTDRTKFIASLSSLNLAKNKLRVFESQQLTLPLQTTLRKKKVAMQSAVKLYGRASVYGVAATATEATYSIAEIYNSFSKSLLHSERPKNLNKNELEQYEILLEDKAFPFEEKAIEFFETNLTHIKDGVYNEWIQKSHTRLKELFPVRYQREAKADAYINVLH